MVSVAGRLEKENTRRRIRVKADENETPNSESQSRRGRAEVRKIGSYLDPRVDIRHHKLLSS
jgi:hypothetical protein